MRGKKALVNVVAAYGNELVGVICGMILPRFILSTFGSEYNGITSSISQFLFIINLLQGGISAATRSALYKPLAENDKPLISGIVRATEVLMLRLALVFSIGLLAVAVIYPFLVINTFDWFFTFTLVLIIGVSSVMQYCFGFTYRVLLTADQRQVVVNVAQMVTVVANTIIAVVIIKRGGSIHLVKLGSAVVYSLNPILLRMYALRKYQIDRKEAPQPDKIKQRWDAFTLQVAQFVYTRSDVLILTIMTDLNHVSIYTVYNVITSGLRMVVTSIISSFGAAFGNMLAKSERETIVENIDISELIVFSLSTIIYSTCAVMIVPFVMLYTKNVTDAEYYQASFGVMLTLSAMISCYRTPYNTLIEAAGLFRETRNVAIFEACTNVVVSVALVKWLNLNGVVIGSIVSSIIRSIQYIYQISKHIVNRSMMAFLIRCLFSLLIFTGVIMVAHVLGLNAAEDFFKWVLNASIVFVIAVILVVLHNIVFYYRTSAIFVKKMVAIVKSDNKKKKA